MPSYGNNGDAGNLGVPYGGTNVSNTGEVDYYQVDSSNIREIGYDDSSGSLLIRFNNGSLYEYYSVPYDILEQLLYAPSVGKAFYQLVRLAGYEYARLE